MPKAGGVERDEKRAFTLFRASAEKGHAPGMYRLALCYKQGVGVKKDRQRYLYWLQKAADAKSWAAAEELEAQRSREIGFGNSGDAWLF